MKGALVGLLAAAMLTTGVIGGVQSAAASPLTGAHAQLGEGDDCDTGFTLAKVVSGPLAQAAAGATFTVRYAVKGSDAEPRTLSVRVGEPVRSAQAPLGSTFVVEEVELPVVAGLVWGRPVLSGEGVVEVGDGRYEVTPATAAGVQLTLTNIADTAPAQEEETTAVTPTVPTPLPTQNAPEPVAPVDGQTTVPPDAAAAAPGAELAATGVEPEVALLVLALVLLGAGVAVSLLAARKRAG